MTMTTPLPWNLLTKNLRGHELLRDKIRQKISKLEKYLVHFPPDSVHLQINLERHLKKPLFFAGLTLRLPSNILHTQKSAADVGGNLRMISSAPHPNPAFYHQTLAQALATGKPTMLLFATPLFCQTRLCGPSYDVMDHLQQRYGSALNYVHVEVYTGLPNPAETNWQLDPAMAAFGLQTEPWLFLIDKTGTIVYRVEGLFTEGEIDQHLKPLLGF